MPSMEPEHQNLVVNEGLTDLEQMKLEMLKTVVRQGLRVMAFVFFFSLTYWLVRSLL